MLSVIRPDLEVGHRRTDLLTSEVISTINFYDVLGSARIDHLEPTFPFKIHINSPRTNQNQPGEVW